MATMKIKYKGPCKGAENRPPAIYLPGYGNIKKGEAFTCDEETAKALLAQDPKVWVADVKPTDPKIEKERLKEQAEKKKKDREAEAQKKAAAETPSSAPDVKEPSTLNKAGK